MIYRAANRGAFSLVELSIVLVILGLLVGGVLSGKSLIRASETRAVITEEQRYRTATFSFRDKYFGLPGDITNATTIWGAVVGCPSAQGTGTQTCDGNGDNSVGTGTGDCEERHRYWQQLANAGLIEGTYSGVAGPTQSCHTVLTNPANAPRSKLGNAGWSIASGFPGVLEPIVSFHSYYDGVYGQRLFFGGQDDVLGSSTWAPVLTTEEAWNIDTKLDDGKPAYGRVQTFKQGATWGTPNCATTNVSATAQYALTSSGNLCAIMFRILP